MGRSETLALLAASCVACTLTGLGNYDVESCPTPLGKATPYNAMVTAATDPAVTATNGQDPIAAFLTNTECVAGDLGGAGIHSGGCLVTADNAPHQPGIAILASSSYLVAAVAATPVTQGAGVACANGTIAIMSVVADVPGSAEPTPFTCGAGAAFPSVAAMPDRQSALVAWYQMPYHAPGAVTSLDPISDCNDSSVLPDGGSAGAPIEIAKIGTAATPTPSLPAMPTTLTSSQAISIGPPALTALGAQDLLLASPDRGAVSVWTIDGTGMPASTPLTVSGLSGARSVSIATDPSQKVAIAAQIGCSSKASIALAVGTKSGFGTPVTVAAANGAFAVQPTVAWVAPNPPQPGYWLVSWISGSSPGHHVLARRFDSSGNPMGNAIDPGVPGVAATVTSSGSLFVLAQPQGSPSPFFESVDLGCAQ